MQVEIYKLFYNDYKFIAELDTGAEVGTNQVTLWFGEKEPHNFGELRFLRTFYFEEANYDNINTFCREFALHPHYRQEIFSGQRHWTKRNALFIRNLYSAIGESTLLSNDTSFERKAREFFRWIDMHTEEIIALPVYQQLQNLDGSFQPDTVMIDPLIQPAVALLNQIPGVATRFSCQGISGKIQFQGYEIMAVSPHMEYAYVSFSALSYFAHDAITSLLPNFPHITNTRIPCNFSSELHLRSTGNNLCFRAELLAIAQCVLAQEQAKAPRSGPAHWEVCDYPERQPCIAGGILPSRRVWLCQPEQVERTLHLLFHLNHWAKASEYLFYVDRQGLYTIKAALIQQAYISQQLEAITYIDGIASFAKDFSTEIAADIAAEFLMDHLSFLFEQEQPTQHEQENEYDVAAKRLFQRICGRKVTCANDIETIPLAQAEEYIYIALCNLIEQARLTRQPIPHCELSALLIGPTDLLTIPYSRERLIEHWHELDENNGRRLDPEGNSLIAFHYTNTNTNTSYTFHLPFRMAERFLAPQCIQQLRLHAGYSREQGNYYGRAISESESNDYPLTEILRELAINVDEICPRQLARKEEIYAAPLREDWNSCDDENCDDEDDIYDSDDEDEYSIHSQPKHTKHKQRNKQRAQRYLRPKCPLCKCAVANIGLTPITHWYHAHPNQDLTIGQATWVLGKSEAALKATNLRPDYYGPTTQPNQKGTRYWKLATLQLYSSE